MVHKTETEIKKTWHGDHSIAVVSICCITYNHVSYISQAIDGFLNQETNYPFEILIHDDASTDGTTEIVKEYEKNYPNIIRAIYQVQNQYSQQPVIAPRFLFPIARGKYIALCEGDDYWTVNYKLQKQVNWLEQNSNYTMCSHAVEILNETIEKVPFYPTVEWKKTENSFLDIFNNHFIPTPSLLFRNELDNYPFFGPDSAGLLAGDMAIELFMASMGFCYYDTEVMGVYRNHDDGITKRDPVESSKAILHWTTLYTKINEVTENKYRKELYYKMCEICINYAMGELRQGNFEKFSTHLIKGFSYGSKNVIIILYNKLSLKMKKMVVG